MSATRSLSLHRLHRNRKGVKYISPKQKHGNRNIVNLGGSLKDSLRTELRSTLDRLLSEVFYVQSDGDRSLGKPGHSCIDPAQTGKV